MQVSVGNFLHFCRVFLVFGISFLFIAQTSFGSAIVLSDIELKITNVHDINHHDFMPRKFVFDAFADSQKTAQVPNLGQFIHLSEVQAARQYAIDQNGIIEFR